MARTSASVKRSSSLCFFVLLLPSFEGNAIGLSQSLRCIKVPPVLLSTATVTKSLAVSRTICATAVAQTPWAHLMCYSNDSCSMYDIKVPLNFADLSQEALTCCTDQLNACTDRNKTIAHGAVALFNCTRMKCNNGNLEEIAEPKGGNFRFLSDQLGCLYAHQVAMNWLSARVNCQSYDADIYVPNHDQDVVALQNHVKTLGGSSYWIGINSLRWANGKAVNSTVWDIGQPEGNTQCGVFFKDASYNVHDNWCTSVYYSVCQFK
ncbi:uncharacterized protein LOC135218290 [Macrobrachium nipponense]|uniref:uncharacterized protein LOC135218290 n=1 Tax=Macrobrachium nipponense TaxID=159736 RepID=UPI0030C88C96